MIKRNLFLLMYDCFSRVNLKSWSALLPLQEPQLTPRHAELALQFTHPYVCVIHEPTKRGYYLNRSYELIIEVADIPRPGEIGSRPMLERIVNHETEFEHRASSFTTPEWAEALPPSEFTTYWLY